MNREQDVELLFAHNPRAGVRFLRPLLIAGTMTSSLLSALDLHIFSLRMPVGWHAMPSCGIAGTWILLQVALQIAQLPVRVLLMRRLNAAAAAGSDDVAALHLLALNRSIAWKTNKRLGAINLAWFVVGVIVSCANGGGPCQMRWLILFHIGLFAVRCFATVAWFVKSFSGDDADAALRARLGDGQPRGLLAVSSIFRRTSARAILVTLPRRTYGNDSADNGVRFAQSACVVCLEDFALGEQLPELACGHCLHEACLEQWLSHRRICPVCQAVCTRRHSGADATAMRPTPPPDQERVRRRHHNLMDHLDE